MGGIAVIRVSGANAFRLVSPLFLHRGKAIDLSEAKPRTALYGEIMEADELIDEVVLTCFHAPHSFTAEHTVEIACHGSIYIRRRILEALINQGCRLAQPGEFTRRAYLNGRMDLSSAEAVADIFHAPHSFTAEHTVEIACHGSIYIRRRILEALINQGCRLAQPGEFTRRAYLNGRMDLSSAEAVADIIASESKAQHQMAMKQLRGGYSEELNALREELLRLTFPRSALLHCRAYGRDCLPWLHIYT